MKALDFYSGVGGWSLGLSLAGIDVVKSYEWWEQAVKTHDLNFQRANEPCDIRTLDVKRVPKGVDFIVGSPPCTQFSFSNRGGNGDIADGLIDMAKFLEIVAHVKPKAWAMENVPRVAGILERELENGGSLHRFAHLFTVITVVHAEQFGLPQKRRRMIAGNFDLDLLLTYRKSQSPITLGKVVSALSKKKVKDPIYGVELPQSALIDHLIEQPLSPEEGRMNREAKEFHPVYNVMTFPDPLDRPARTVTATCTRVSRESIVIEDPITEGHRRLSIRERACLQGFPITFQFLGSYSDRLKMIGNAIPPALTYFIGHALLRTPAEDVPHLSAIGSALPNKAEPQKSAKPDRLLGRYQPTRRFRAAIPGLRFGSGMRFELANSFVGDDACWSIKFFFGTSKAYQELVLDRFLMQRLKKSSTWQGLSDACEAVQGRVMDLVSLTSPNELQAVWTHKHDGFTPYDLIDDLGEIANSLIPATSDLNRTWIANFVASVADSNQGDSPLALVSRKFNQYDSRVLSGIIVGCIFNESMSVSQKSMGGMKIQAVTARSTKVRRKTAT